MSVAKSIAEREKLSELISTLLESSFYLNMNIRERLALVEIMLRSIQ